MHYNNPSDCHLANKTLFSFSFHDFLFFSRHLTLHVLSFFHVFSFHTSQERRMCTTGTAFVNFIGLSSRQPRAAARARPRTTILRDPICKEAESKLKTDPRPLDVSGT